MKNSVSALLRQVDVAGIEDSECCYGEPMDWHPLHSSQDHQQDGTLVDTAAERRWRFRWDIEPLLRPKLLCKFWDLSVLL